MPGASFSELARMSGITVQSVHGAVKALVAAGLVRDRNARAGSASTLEITTEGALLLRRARRAAAEVDERLFGPDADPIQQRLGAAVRAAFPGPPPSWPGAERDRRPSPAPTFSLTGAWPRLQET
ncbi:hypothetical protein GCM10009678_73130 [Actinomadura kijaniata]|uniref:Putative transcriptional regulator n=1 Tax=Actinomadura namibiensis TaxID=182080 RepID=A0A7W3M0D9_ACTNM|nr:MarR family winged helix-turn-helix transcriptional regulator [Actinomadura namibiensis]MBA8957564.1 putative transcriptional regulator [Actinomadura namibiensis]